MSVLIHNGSEGVSRGILKTVQDKYIVTRTTNMKLYVDCLTVPNQ